MRCEPFVLLFFIFFSHLHVPNMQAILPPRREVLVFGTGGSFFPT
jgi:hypothetical protein